jgi:activating signal cointegrator complex subunit 3
MQVYDANKGRFTDLGVLDVQQMFGRAGRPQFDTFGEATIITTHDKLSHYLAMLTAQTAIESQFIRSLPDNLNAEVVLGTVSNMKEAVSWLSYSYLNVRIRRNPLAYGVSQDTLVEDPGLEEHRKELLIRASKVRAGSWPQSVHHKHRTQLPLHSWAGSQCHV